MTDLEDMERRIRQIFDKAGKELKAKWSEWLKDMDAELAGLQKEYEAAKASGDAAATRKAGIALSRAKKTKIMGNEYYDKMVKQAAKRLQEANEQAMAYINGKMPKVYASSFNGSTNQIAKDLPHNIGISFDLVDESTVARLMRDPTLDLHDLQGGINGKKMAAWNNRAISSEILQGIVAGDSIPRIAGRLMNVAGMDEKAATRTARTMTTGAENAGREDSYLRAQDMGIALHQQWIAALDGRTRHSHRQLDGEVQEVGKRFSNGLRFPGDPEGPPEEICNCRCTLIAVLDGFDREKVDRWNKLEGQSYEEWKAGGRKTKGNEEPKELSGIDKIKNLIEQHEGDWTPAELKDVGKAFEEQVQETVNKYIEQAEAELKDLKVERGKLADKCDELDLELLKAMKDGDEERQIEIKKERGLLTDKIDELSKKSFSVQGSKYDAQSKAVSETLKQIRPIGGVDESNVSQYANLDAYAYNKKQTMDKTIQAMNYYPSDWLKKSADYPIELQPHWTTSRAYYSSSGEIRFADRTHTNVHELGHRFEQVVPDILKAERQFYQERTSGLALEWMGPGYGRNERTRRDDFVDAYMGKDYGGQAFELVSMGFQHVFTNYNKLDSDPDMRRWIFGILSAL